jgi:hypothetical protein
MRSKNILCWNVSGLNAGTHQDAVRELLRVEHISFVCFQETKMDVISDFDLLQILEPGFEYFYLPDIHTRGGILVAWCPSILVLSNTSTRQYSVSAKVHPASGGPEWWLSSVYGPARDTDRPTLLDELHELHQIRQGPSVLCGDFNMI